MKIITSNPPSSNDNHGCPFRHFSSTNLETRLLRDNVKRSDVDQILALAKNKHYQLACTKHFEVTHPQTKGKIDAIEHPNQYYEASKKLDEEDEANQPTSTDALQEDMEIDD
jgi:DNA primase large subunit